MGWKAVKDHYPIGHLVQVRDGRICIGSGYVYDLLHIDSDGSVAWGKLGPSDNHSDLQRYFAEMTADVAKLRELIETPDAFARSLVVYTWDGGQIIEKRAEALGWPNCTHDGELMYENTFSTDKETVVGWAKRSAELGIEAAQGSLHEALNRVLQCRSSLARERFELAQLDADYPTVTRETTEAAE